MMVWMSPRSTWLASAVLFGVFPVALVVAHLADTIATGSVGWARRSSRAIEVQAT